MSNEIRIGRYANILMDRWFKRTFGTEQAKPLLTLMLKELIPERDIAEISLAPEEHVNEDEAHKDIRVDIECMDKDGTRFIVEMQLASQSGFYERAIFNASFGVLEQLARGAKEYDYPAVYFIGIMNFSIHKGSDKVLYRYTIQERDSHELMSDRLQYIFLELPNSENVAKDKATDVDKFSDTLLNMDKWDERPEGYDSELIVNLLKSAEIATFAPEVRRNYIYDMTTARDYINQLAYAEKQGIEQGIEKGISLGAERERRSVALAMLKDGVDPALIAKYTGLSIETVKTLRAEDQA